MDSARGLRRLALASLFLATPAGAAPATVSPSSALEPNDSASILAIDDVHAGQKGHGVSVFSGSDRERFDVEIVGVLREFAAGEDLILARLSGRDLESTGVIAGMSGSPVYVDGKLIGAVALGWPFSKGAIAGVRPIESMLRLSEDELALGSSGRPIGGSLPASKLDDGAERLHALATAQIDEAFAAGIFGRLRGGTGASAGGGGVGGPGLPFSLAGFGPASRAWIESALGTRASAVSIAGVAAAGSAGDSNGLASSSSLRGGDAVAAILVDGDVRMAATGTVTARDGDRVLAFGHPFLGNGPIDLPMAPAEIVTVMPSLYSSFKLSNLGSPMGAFRYDAQAGIVGRIGATPRMVPLSVRIGDHTYRMRLARMPELISVLAASSLLGALDGAGYLGGEQGMSIEFTASLRGETSGARSIALAQDFDGEGAPIAAVRYLLAALDYLATNPLERVEFEDLEVHVTRAPAVRQSFVVAAHADRAVVQPGEEVDLVLDLKAARGALERVNLKVRVPESTPDGRLSLIVGDGATVDGVRFTLTPQAPLELSQALDFLDQLHAKSDLVVLGIRSARGVSLRGEVLSDLPGSIRALWGTSAQGGAASLRQGVSTLLERRMPAPIEGAARVDLEVRRQPRSTAMKADDF